MSRPRSTRTHTPIPTVESPRGAVTSADASQLLRLLHLASPALPIGAFHFSQGLEYAVECGWVKDEASSLDWIDGIASASLATLDLPVLERLRESWRQDDLASVLRWNAFLIASRETEELRAEDRHLGHALLRVLVELGLATKLFPPGAANTPPGVSHACAFAFACARWNIEPQASSLTYAWAWVENQVLAAVKLVPLGQSAAQRMLHALTGRIPLLVERAHNLADSDIGVSSVVNAIVSGRHEIQYSRLFKS